MLHMGEIIASETKPLHYVPSRREYTSLSWEWLSVWVSLFSLSSIALTYSLSGTQGSFTRACRHQNGTNRQEIRETQDEPSKMLL